MMSSDATATSFIILSEDEYDEAKEQYDIYFMESGRYYETDEPSDEEVHSFIADYFKVDDFDVDF